MLPNTCLTIHTLASMSDEVIPVSYPQEASEFLKDCTAEPQAPLPLCLACEYVGTLMQSKI